MKFNLFFDSNLAKLQPGGDNYKSHDFTFRFTPSINLGRAVNHKVALNHLYMSYSWYNVSGEYNNNTFRYRKKTGSGGTWKAITLPNEMYDYSGINNYIPEETGKDADGNDILALHFDISIYRVIFNIHPYYEVDLTQGNFAGLVGFDSKVFSGAGGCG